MTRSFVFVCSRWPSAAAGPRGTRTLTTARGNQRVCPSSKTYFAEAEAHRSEMSCRTNSEFPLVGPPGGHWRYRQFHSRFPRSLAPFPAYCTSGNLGGALCPEVAWVRRGRKCRPGATSLQTTFQIPGAARGSPGPRFPVPAESGDGPIPDSRFPGNRPAGESLWSSGW
jgi:hypothetical protein